MENRAMVGRNTNKWYYDSIPVFALNNRQKKDNIYHTKGGIDILTIVVKSHKNVPKSAMKERVSNNPMSVALL